MALRLTQRSSSSIVKRSAEAKALDTHPAPAISAGEDLAAIGLCSPPFPLDRPHAPSRLIGLPSLQASSSGGLGLPLLEGLPSSLCSIKNTRTVAKPSVQGVEHPDFPSEGSYKVMKRLRKPLERLKGRAEGLKLVCAASLVELLLAPSTWPGDQAKKSPALFSKLSAVKTSCASSLFNVLRLIGRFLP